jgi:hypothetical protein
MGQEAARITVPGCFYPRPGAGEDVTTAGTCHHNDGEIKKGEKQGIEGKV